MRRFAGIAAPRSPVPTLAPSPRRPRAQHVLGLSQPAVTARIRTLEQQTGHDLFIRLPCGVEPAPIAHELAVRVAAPLDARTSRRKAGVLPRGQTAPVHLAGPSELFRSSSTPPAGLRSTLSSRPAARHRRRPGRAARPRPSPSVRGDLVARAEVRAVRPAPPSR
ncbi:hypothetical protein B1H18_18715 [Streptomyces tsukubensis]|uniref:HTH lysR-type domain-containing protein n=1 Tax=Streptomyces tsukubensis TaxID=83656 RepID=A0A1V4A617_9ACTN|nr:hypothetical protein B1H18_18715 [Streptomyces tsukubensis]